MAKKFQLRRSGEVILNNRKFKDIESAEKELMSYFYLKNRERTVITFNEMLEAFKITIVFGSGLSFSDSSLANLYLEL